MAYISPSSSFSSPAISAGFLMLYPGEAYQDGYVDAYPEMEVTTFEEQDEADDDDGEDIQRQWDDCDVTGRP